jgi:predicted short-subunit dehydrogenase-like oxidoreductase (DUF2520 family)
MGKGLLRALRSAGVMAHATAGSSPSKATLARADVCVLAVPDRAIGSTALAISDALSRRGVVLHLSGSRGVEALEALRAVRPDLAAGVAHPLLSVIGASADFEGATFFVAGDPRARAAAKKLAHALGARAVVRSVHGARYHAAAALLANGGAALASHALTILESLDVSERDARLALSALLHSVARNIGAVGLPGALTGPIVRGDGDTVAAHREALAALPDAAQLYDALGPSILALADKADPKIDRGAIAALFGLGRT